MCVSAVIYIVIVAMVVDYIGMYSMLIEFVLFVCWLEDETFCCHVLGHHVVDDTIMWYYLLFVLCLRGL